MHLHLDVLLPVILADNIEAEIGAEPLRSFGREEVQKGERKGGKKIEVDWRRSEKGKVKRKKGEKKQGSKRMTNYSSGPCYMLHNLQ